MTVLTDLSFISDLSPDLIQDLDPDLIKDFIQDLTLNLHMCSDPALPPELVPASVPYLILDLFVD